MEEGEVENGLEAGEVPIPPFVFSGHPIRPGEFITAMAHFYRGEISRSNVWRSRLDNTTNWAVVTTAAVLTFAFGSTEHSHVVILLSLLLIGLFLIIEARRYRYYELWALRVRFLETDFFATILKPPFTPHAEWANRLVESLLTPRFPISFWEAIGRRLRRNFIWIFLILGLAWTLKLSLYPTAAMSLQSFFDHASLGPIPGKLVFLSVLVLLGVVLGLALFTAGLRASAGEVLSHDQLLKLPTHILKSLAKAASELPFVHRHEQLVIIITDKAAEVGDQLLQLLKRGVTSIEGTGMYSGQPRNILFCAVTPDEIVRLKSMVYASDPTAFVVVNPTEEVLGGGFADLGPNWRRKRSMRSRTGGDSE